MESDGERRLENRRRRARVELAGCVGRSRLRHGRRQHRRRRRVAQTRAVVYRAVIRRPDVGPRHRHLLGSAPVGGVRRRFQDWEDPLGAERPHRRAHRAQAPEEQLRVGNAAHRRRTGLRVLRKRRPVCFRHERRAGMVEADGSIQSAQRLVVCRVAGAARRSRLHRQRQRRPVVHRRVRQADGRGNLEDQPRRRQQLDDALHLGERAEDRDRHVGVAESALVRSERQVAVDADRDELHSDSNAARRRRVIVHQLGLSGRSAPAGLRDPSRRLGGHLARKE